MKTNINFFLYIIITSNLIIQILSQLDNIPLSKIISCLTIVNDEYEKSDINAELYSASILKCFITITDTQAYNFVVSMGKGQKIMNKNERKKLLDINSLKYMSEKELERKSEEMNKALKEFQKMQSKLMGKSSQDYEEGDYDEYDDEYMGDSDIGGGRQGINYFSLIPRGIFGIISEFFSYLYFFFILGLVYLFLFSLRKMGENDKTKIKKPKEKIYEEDYFDESDNSDDDIKENSYDNNAINKKKKKK